MLIKEVAKRTCRYIADVLPLRSVKPAKVAGVMDDVLPAKAKVDTFELVADGGIPKRLQKILDDLGPFYKQKGEFLTDLYRTSPSKFDYIYDHKYFNGGWPIFNDKEFVRAVDVMSEKELVKTFDEIEELYKTLPLEGYDYDKATKEMLYRVQTPRARNLAQLTILKVHNKEAYEYLLNHPNKEHVSSLLAYFDGHLNGSALETLTIPQIRQIEGVGALKLSTDSDVMMKGSTALTHYVESSDDFVRKADEVEALSKFLGSSKVTETFTAFRGNRDTGMFNSVILDSALAKKTKWNVLKNMFKAKKVKVHDYTGKYETHFASKTDLFKYVMGKETLTLADAMQVAKYGDDSYRREIIELIKKSQIEDTRFKSITFDKGMATGWMPEQGTSNTGIFENVTVREGCQGAYSRVNNRQAEFVLNNNPKRITFDDVVYDAERDIFSIQSVYESI